MSNEEVLSLDETPNNGHAHVFAHPRLTEVSPFGKKTTE
jgi:hypothetical protein